MILCTKHQKARNSSPLWKLFLLLSVGMGSDCSRSSFEPPQEFVDDKTGAIMVMIPPVHHYHDAIHNRKDKESTNSNTTLLMDKFEVTNAQFELFVSETGYITVAERDFVLKDGAVDTSSASSSEIDSLIPAGSMIFKKSDRVVPLNQYLEWWEWTPGTSWRHPFGPDSDLSEINDHPVVHVAWEDAQAYCQWANKRLPTEEEWLHAAKGGKKNQIYPWGDEDINEAPMKANFWQGLFPVHNTLNDGYEGTAPVGSYPPNAFGLHDMAGNVWELTADFFSIPYGKKYHWKKLDPDQRYEVIIRGGSYLCNDQYCSGYRLDQRMTTAADTGAGHLGFRCVKDTIVLPK